MAAWQAWHNKFIYAVQFSVINREGMQGSALPHHNTYSIAYHYFFVVIFLFIKDV